MNQQIIEEAYFLLRQKVQVAIALYMIENCSEKEKMIDYVRNFQYKCRIKSKRCNIPLERQIFLQQMILLLPKFSDFQSKNEPLSTPMEIDVDGEIDPAYVDFSLQLIMVTEFLDALHFLLTVLKLKSVSSEDIFRIFSKFGDLDLNLRFYNDFGIIKISVNAIKQALQHMNLKKTIKECMIEIVRLFKIYLNDLPQQQSLSSEEALVWMKKANTVMMKCIDSFAYEGQYQDMIVNLLHESMELSFIDQPKNHHYEIYRYHLIRKWRYHKLLCTNAINIFIRSLEDVEEKLDDFDKKKYLVILKFSKLFLKTYCEMHYSKNSLQTFSEDSKKISCTNSVSRKKKHIFPSDRKFLANWFESLAGLIASKYLHPAIRSLALSCCEIISSTAKLEFLNRKSTSKSVNNQK